MYFRKTVREIAWYSFSVFFPSVSASAAAFFKTDYLLVKISVKLSSRENLSTVSIDWLSLISSKKACELTEIMAAWYMTRRMWNSTVVRYSLKYFGCAIVLIYSCVKIFGKFI